MLRFEALHNVPDMRAFLEFRCMLEAEAAARAALCSDAILHGQVGVRYRQFDLAVRRREPAIDEDVAFHDAIAQASGNRFLIATLAALREQRRLGIQFIRQLSASRPAGRSAEVCAEHLAIQEAISQRDPDAARDAMAAHLRGGVHSVNRP